MYYIGNLAKKFNVFNGQTIWMFISDKFDIIVLIFIKHNC